MAFRKARLMAAGLVGIMALTGCGYGDGYGGMAIGAGYGGGYYDGYGYGPGGYGGWYDDFYYPGSGCYVYDRAGTRHRWNDRQRGYWEGRRRNPDRQAQRPDNRNDRWRPNRPNTRPDARPPRPLTREDRRSLREFGATVGERRAAARRMEREVQQGRR